MHREVGPSGPPEGANAFVSISPVMKGPKGKKDRLNLVRKNLQPLTKGNFPEMFHTVTLREKAGGEIQQDSEQDNWTAHSADFLSRSVKKL